MSANMCGLKRHKMQQNNRYHKSSFQFGYIWKQVTNWQHSYFNFHHPFYDTWLFFSNLCCCSCYQLQWLCVIWWSIISIENVLFEDFLGLKLQLFETFGLLTLSRVFLTLWGPWKYPKMCSFRSRKASKMTEILYEYYYQFYYHSIWIKCMI